MDKIVFDSAQTDGSVTLSGVEVFTNRIRILYSMKIGINVKLGVVAGLLICIVWYLFAKSLGFYSVEV